MLKGYLRGTVSKLRGSLLIDHYVHMVLTLWFFGKDLVSSKETELTGCVPCVCRRYAYTRHRKRMRDYRELAHTVM